MEAVWAKVVSLFLIGVFTLASGLLPLKISSNRGTESRNKGRGTLLNVLLSFSGGVLFATCFIHLLPEVHEGFQTSTNLQSGTNRTIVYATGAESGLEPDASTRPREQILPWGEFTVCVGFFIIYAVEEIVEHFVCRSCEKQHHHHNEKDHEEKPLGNGPEPCLAPVHSIHGAHRDPHDSRDCEGMDDQRTVTVDDQAPLFARGSAAQYGSCTDEKGLTNSSITSEELPASLDRAEGSLVPVTAMDPQSFLSVLRGLMLVCALSFHSFFEGMAIGLQNTSSDVWNTFLGVAFHKFVVVFCVGVELVCLKTKTKVFVIYMVAFALMTPLGISIGIVLTEIDLGMGQYPLILATLQGLSTGTLLYVTFFEILTKTKGIELSSLMNFAAILTGFASMTAFHLLE